MRRELFSWVKPFGHYVSRSGKRFFVRPKKNAMSRQFHYCRRLRIAPLGARVMLTTYELAASVAAEINVTFSPTAAIFINESNPRLGEVQYPNTKGNSLEIVETNTADAQTISIPSDIIADSLTVEQTTPTQKSLTLNIAANITTGLLSFDGNRPYALQYQGPGSSTISGGTTYTQSIISIQSTLYVDIYQSVTATIDSAVTGPGCITTIDTGTLQIASSLNSYTGGTDIEDGTVQLERDANGAPATLGSGVLTMNSNNNETLDLNGCPLTVTSLDASSSYALITDSSSGAGTTGPAVTLFTLDNTSNASPSTFAGNFSEQTGCPQIRVIKTGGGTLVLDEAISNAGGFEIDDGEVQLGQSFSGLPMALTMNGGTFDLNGTERAKYYGVGQPVLDLSQLDGSGGTITDGSASAATYPSLLDIAPSSTGHPSVFGGRIEDGSCQLVALELDNGSGTLVLTANMSGAEGYPGWTGGTVVASGCLQIGDGQKPGSAIEGAVDVGTANGLIFDVAGEDSVDFSGAIFNYGIGVGSILKTGAGTLTLEPALQSTYLGALTVNDGELELGSTATPPVSTSGALAEGTQLIIDNGAIVDLDGFSTEALASVTLNDGDIINSSAMAAVLTANVAFNIANGAIGGATGGDITLAGTASLSKRTDGTADIYADGTYSGGTFDDSGSGLIIELTSNITLSTITPLYWCGGSGDWNTTSENWSTTQGGAANTTWPTNDPSADPNDVTQDYAAVFNSSGTFTVTVATTVEPCEIEFLAGNVTINDSTGYDILVPDPSGQPESKHDNLEIYVAYDVTATLGCAVQGSASAVEHIVDGNLVPTGDFTYGAGSLTKEGCGTLNVNSSNNNYWGGTYIDDGKVVIGSSYAFGNVVYSSLGATVEGGPPISDPGDLTVDDNGTLDLNGYNLEVSSLNSSYSGYAANGTITDSTDNSEQQNPPTMLAVYVDGTPPVFDGEIKDGDSKQQVALYVGTPDFAAWYTTAENAGTAVDKGLLFTLNGSIISSGGTYFDGIMEIGDGENNGSIQGLVSVGWHGAGGDVDDEGGGELVFDVAGSASTEEAFNGSIVSALPDAGAVVKTGDGTLQFYNDSKASVSYNGATVVQDGTFQLEGGLGSGGDYCLAPGATVIVGTAADSTATLDLNGCAPSYAISSLTVYGGLVEDTSSAPVPLQVAGLIEMFSGTISANLAGTAALVKSGGVGVPGELGGPGVRTRATLGGDNSYAGETIVMGGVLRVQNSSALGQMSAGEFVDNGATLELQMTGCNAIAAAAPLFLAGDGLPINRVVNGPQGALDNESGNNFWSGAIFLDNGTSDTEINCDSGNTLFLTEGINGVAPGAPLTFSGGGDISVSGPTEIGSNVSSVTNDSLGTVVWVDEPFFGGTVSGTGTFSTSLFQVTPAFSTIVVNYGATLDLGAYSVTVDGSAVEGDQGDAAITATITDGTITLTGAAMITTGPSTQLDASLVYQSSAVSTIAGGIGDGPSPTSLTLDCPGAATYQFVSGNTYAEYLSNALILSGPDSNYTYTGDTTLERGSLVTYGVLVYHGPVFLAVTDSESSGGSSPGLVYTSQPSGAYGPGGVIDITVPMGQTVTVTGDPELALALGSNTEYAQYLYGSGTSTLIFQYVVQPGDNTAALDYTSTTPIVLNGGSIDAGGQSFTPVLPAPGTSGSLSADETLEITGAAPAVTAIDCASNQLAVGATSLRFSISFSQPVNGVNASDFALTGGNSAGTISSVTGSGSSYTVTVNGVSGSGTLGLELVNNGTIINASGVPLGGYGADNGSFTGQQYALSSEFYWDANGGGTGGGSGNFTDPNWDVGGLGGPMLTFVNGADLVFPAGTGTVTISGQWTVNSLTFEGDGAVLQNTAPTDTLTVTSGNVTVNAGTADVNIVLAGSGGLNKYGAGTLALGAANTFTSVVEVDGGTLNLGSVATTGNFEVQSGATLVMGYGYSGTTKIDDGGTVQFDSSTPCEDRGCFYAATFDVPASGTATFDTDGNFVRVASIKSDLGGGSYDVGTIDGTVNIIDSVGGGLLEFHNLSTINGTLNIGAGATFEVDEVFYCANTINNNGTIVIDGTLELQNCASIKSGGLTFIYGQLTVDDLGYYAPAADGAVGTIVVASGASVVNYGEMWTNVSNNGYFYDGADFVGLDAVEILGGAGSGFFNNQSGGELVIGGGGFIYNFDSMNNNGEIINNGFIDNRGTFTNYGGEVYNYGTIYSDTGAEIDNIDTLINTGTIYNSITGVFNTGGGYTENDGIVNNYGTLTVENGSFVNYGTANNYGTAMVPAPGEVSNIVNNGAWNGNPVTWGDCG